MSKPNPAFIKAFLKMFLAALEEEDRRVQRVIDALRPRDYKVTLIAPDGSLTESPRFATKPEAQRWAKAHARINEDVVVTHCENSPEKN